VGCDHLEGLADVVEAAWGADEIGDADILHGLDQARPEVPLGHAEHSHHGLEEDR
jgi:hypothetical protein